MVQTIIIDVNRFSPLLFKRLKDKEDVKKVLIEDKALHEECYKCQVGFIIIIMVFL